MSDDAEALKEPKPVRNFLLFAAGAAAVFVGVVIWLQVSRQREEQRADERLYGAITNEVMRVGKNVERIAPLRQFEVRRSGMDQIMFKAWVEVGSTGGPVRRELEARLRDNYLTNGPMEILSVRIKDVIRE